jgi:hypothetical protein
MRRRERIGKELSPVVVNPGSHLSDRRNGNGDFDWC